MQRDFLHFESIILKSGLCFKTIIDKLENLEVNFKCLICLLHNYQINTEMIRFHQKNKKKIKKFFLIDVLITNINEISSIFKKWLRNI